MWIDFDYLCKVKKSRLHIIILLWLSVFATSCVKLDIQEDYNVSPELTAIDTLMWHHPDSALAVMMEFAASPKADSLDVYNGHYCQVLIAELSHL